MIGWTLTIREMILYRIMQLLVTMFAIWDVRVDRVLVKLDHMLASLHMPVGMLDRIRELILMILDRTCMIWCAIPQGIRLIADWSFVKFDEC